MAGAAALVEIPGSLGALTMCGALLIGDWRFVYMPAPGPARETPSLRV